MGALKNDSSLDVRMLRIFAAVAAADSLSAAAQALNITQSAVSQTVTQIESILGMRVLDRTRRPYRLTPAGVALQRQSRQIVDDIDRLIAQVREADLMNRPAIRIGMIDSFAATTGPAIVKRLTQSASQVLVWSGLAYGHAQALLNRQVDIIVTTDALEDVDGLVRRPILNEPFVVVAPAVRADEFAPLDLRQMAQAAPFIRFSGRSHFGAMIERHLRRCGVTAPPFLEIDTSDVVMAMIAANLGWALMTPLCLLQGRSWLDQVVVLPLPGPSLARTLHQVSRLEEYQEMADMFWQLSRQALETEIFPQVTTQLPWLGRQMRLC
ncbi:LysR family regulatory protein [Bordetella pertussis]|uniref:LysR-family transcriptional regulator n=11 Tax=Pseudomonadota TaxID=1224 RepID=Q7VT78_BORPE|nr:MULTISPECIES: LysR family transcriptional regulator [Bordetella]ETH40530.1 LysR substrate-binding domain protein [Bordetella pertussis H918]ETH44554.1 LysR substrate-binding domain protein [Bordetella pertussis H939]ETH48832.1 LysR substrate-binding domain protein [Bordetella pertussis H921]ETH72489.1 LysR substrate-binding domain protein [Bordetella pertussis STO1-CHLA-0011]ETH81249.1 LysR substrate-binding domain protein [Bordetella pertussis STO1-CHOC-0017]ETH86828.1 LysR substrate-bind